MGSEGHLFTFSDRTLMPLLTSSAVKSLMERQGWYVLTAYLTTLKFGIRQETIQGFVEAFSVYFVAMLLL